MSNDPNMPPGGYPAPPGKPVFGPNGRKIIYDKDGKPCRQCNTIADFKFATSSKDATSALSGMGAAFGGAFSSGGKPKKVQQKKEIAKSKECPPDVEELGRASWTLLHTIAASYPENPSLEQQLEMKVFINIFSKIYPCWFCAGDFQKFIKIDEPKVRTQEDFGRWLCNAHNSVNVKLGKPVFDCNLWKERWKDGWKDGRCD
ncbi:unnamed protein product [[Candida] boidinii]|uniref:Unnamed protein product n=1 Tax=Candida boidinii TaxID=5477 RepID=A0ACB5TWE9_CANBO|nr:unnamed protein product [[Candida] boidinii]